MIAEIVAAVAGVGAVTGWIFAFVARGQTVKAIEAKSAEAEHTRTALESLAQRTAEHSDALDQIASLTHQLGAAKGALAIVGAQRDRALDAKRDLLHRLEVAGVHVGDLVIDAAFDRLYPNAARGDTGTGEDRREEDPGGGGPVPDPDPNPAG